MLHVCSGLSILFSMEANVQQKHERLSREEWLERALDIIATEGETKLRIDRLVSKLGVSKGSFYWHFKDRADFVLALAEFWARYFTFDPLEQSGKSTKDPKAAARWMYQAIVEQDLRRYDVAIRAWAAHEPEIAPIVKRVDQARMKAAKALFKDLGFSGTELDLRTRLFITYVSLQDGLFVRQSKKRKRQQIDQVIDFFTR